jgi:putative membrane protein insertion efficiency factor
MLVCAVLIFLVRAYKVVLSPLMGDCCRFEPTCSAYCVEALRTHGAIRGVWLTVRRLLRCRPLGPSGYDPVPPKSSNVREFESSKIVAGTSN